MNADLTSRAGKAATRSDADTPTILPTYYVRHPDGSYSVAQPQPQSSEMLNLVVAACHEAQDFTAKAQKQAADALASRDDLVSSIRELKNALEFLLSGVECNCVAGNDLSRARAAIAAATGEQQ